MSHYVKRYINREIFVNIPKSPCEKRCKYLKVCEAKNNPGQEIACLKFFHYVSIVASKKKYKFKRNRYWTPTIGENKGKLIDLNIPTREMYIKMATNNGKRKI